MGFTIFGIISESVSDYSYLTIIFFLVSIHIWFAIKNSALNHSPFFNDVHQFNALYLKDFLVLSFIVILMLEYCLAASVIGNVFAFRYVIYSTITIALFLFLIDFELNSFLLKEGKWRKLLSFELDENSHGNSPSVSLNLQNSISSPNNFLDFTGSRLRLFTSKSNPYIGGQLPVSGVIEGKITVGDDPNFYMFRYNTPVNYGSYVNSHCIIRQKDNKQDLGQDKVEILYLMIPDAKVLRQHLIQIEDLRYVGKAYARPIN